MAEDVYFLDANEEGDEIDISSVREQSLRYFELHSRVLMTMLYRDRSDGWDAWLGGPINTNNHPKKFRTGYVDTVMDTSGLGNVFTRRVTSEFLNWFELVRFHPVVCLAHVCGTSDNHLTTGDFGYRLEISRSQFCNKVGDVPTELKSTRSLFLSVYEDRVGLSASQNVSCITNVKNPPPGGSLTPKLCPLFIGHFKTVDGRIDRPNSEFFEHLLDWASFAELPMFWREVVPKFINSDNPNFKVEQSNYFQEDTSNPFKSYVEIYGVPGQQSKET